MLLSVTDMLADIQTHRRCSAELLLQTPGTTSHIAQAQHMAKWCVAAADGRRAELSEAKYSWEPTTCCLFQQVACPLHIRPRRLFSKSRRVAWTAASR